MILVEMRNFHARFVPLRLWVIYTFAWRYIGSVSIDTKPLVLIFKICFLDCGSFLMLVVQRQSALS